MQVRIFLKLLKIAKITPLPKNGCTNRATNYRPISVLSPFSKIFEKILYSLIDQGRRETAHEQGRILQSFKVFSAHPAISQAHALITFNKNFWIFSSLIFVISTQLVFFFSVSDKMLFFQRLPMTQHSLVQGRN